MDDTKREVETDMERAIGACQALTRKALQILDATDNPLSMLRQAEAIMDEATTQASRATAARQRLDAMLMAWANEKPA